MALQCPLTAAGRLLAEAPVRRVISWVPVDPVTAALHASATSPTEAFPGQRVPAFSVLSSHPK